MAYRKLLILFLVTILIFLFFYFFSNYEFNKKNKNIVHNKLFYADMPIPTKWSVLYRKFEYSNKSVEKCPKDSIVILLVGQSNAANEVLSYNYKKTNNLNFYNGKCFTLSNPVLATTGNKDNLSVGISNYLNRNRDFIFLTHAWSGTSVMNWGSDQQSPLTDFSKKQLSHIEKLGLDLDFLIWVQGETDAQLYSNLDIGQGPNFFNVNGKEKYYKLAFEIFIKDLIDNNENRKKFKTIITSTTRCYRTKKNELINSQQKQLANKDTIVLEVTDTLNDQYRYDKCHLNELGVDTVAKEIANVINSFIK